MIYMNLSEKIVGDFSRIRIGYFSEYGLSIEKSINVKFYSRYLNELIEKSNIDTLPFFMNKNVFELNNDPTGYTIYARDGIGLMHSICTFDCPHSLEDLFTAVVQLFKSSIHMKTKNIDFLNFIKSEALRSRYVNDISFSYCNYESFLDELTAYKDKIIDSFDNVEIVSCLTYDSCAGAGNWLSSFQSRVSKCITNYAARYSKEQGYVVTMDKTVCKLNSLCDEIKENYDEPFEEIDDRLNNPQKDRYLNEYGIWCEKV